VKAFLQTISEAQGASYNTLYGGGSFSDYSKHPDPVGRHSPAGAYQITQDTSDEFAPQLRLTDFSPHTQDMIATRMLANSGAIRLIETNDIEGAVRLAVKRWSSLPGGVQSRMSMSKFLSSYKMRRPGE
jgi:lysozyme